MDFTATWDDVYIRMITVPFDALGRVADFATLYDKHYGTGPRIRVDRPEKGGHRLCRPT